jgi:hypothetical protein
MPDTEVNAAALKMFAESMTEGRKMNELRRQIEKLEIADLTRRIERLEKLQSAEPGKDDSRL